MDDYIDKRLGANTGLDPNRPVQPAISDAYIDQRLDNPNIGLDAAEEVAQQQEAQKKYGFPFKTKPLPQLPGVEPTPSGAVDAYFKLPEHVRTHEAEREPGLLGVVGRNRVPNTIDYRHPDGRREIISPGKYPTTYEKIQESIANPEADPVKQGPDFMVRADASFGTTADSVVSRIKRHYPDAEIKEVNENGRKIFLFKRSPADPEFARLTPELGEKLARLARFVQESQIGLVDTFAQDDSVNTEHRTRMTELASEIAKDIFADNAGEAPGIILGLIAGGGAGSLLAFMGKAFAGDTVGEFGKQALDPFSDKPWGADLDAFTNIPTTRDTRVDDAIEHGLAGAMTAGIFHWLAKLMHGLSGAGFVDVSPEARRVMGIAKKLNLKMPMPQQVSDSPFFRRLGGQSEALVPTIGRYRKQEDEVAYQRVRELADPDEYALVKEQLDKGIKDVESDLFATLIDVKGYLHDVPPEVAGKALTDGIKEYARRSQLIVDMKYNQAKAFVNPQFNIAHIKKRLEVITKGNQSLREVPHPQGLLGPNGQPIMINEPFTSSGAPGNQLQDIISRIRDIRDDVPNYTDPATGHLTSSLDQIRGLVRELYEYTIPNVNGLRPPDAWIAKDVRDMLLKVLDNPTNIGASKVFARAWREASTAARRRFDNLEMAVVINALKAGEGDTIMGAGRRVQLLMGEGGTYYEGVAALKKMLTPKQFETLQDYMVYNIVRDPYKMTAKMDRLDANPYFKNLALPSTTTRVLREVGDKFKQLEASGLKDVIEDQATAYSMFKNIQRNATEGTATVDQLWKAAGGANSPLGKSIRAALIDDIIKTSLSKGQAEKTLAARGVFGSTLADDISGTKLSAQHIKETMESAEFNTLTRFLKPSDKEVIEGVAEYLAFIQRSNTDAGAQLAAAGITANLRRFKAEAFGALLENMLVGRIATSSWGQRFLVGGPMGRDDIGRSQITQSFRQLGNALGQINYDLELKRQSDELLKHRDDSRLPNFASGGLVENPARTAEAQSGAKPISEFISAWWHGVKNAVSPFMLNSADFERNQIAREERVKMMQSGDIKGAVKSAKDDPVENRWLGVGSTKSVSKPSTTAKGMSDLFIDIPRKPTPAPKGIHAPRTPKKKDTTKEFLRQSYGNRAIPDDDLNNKRLIIDDPVVPRYAPEGWSISKTNSTDPAKQYVLTTPKGEQLYGDSMEYLQNKLPRRK